MKGLLHNGLACKSPILKTLLTCRFPCHRNVLLPASFFPPADSCLQDDRQLLCGFSEQILHFSIFFLSSYCLEPLFLFVWLCPLPGGSAGLPAPYSAQWVPEPHPAKCAHLWKPHSPLSWHRLIHAGEGRSWVISPRSACPGQDLAIPSESSTAAARGESCKSEPESAPCGCWPGITGWHTGDSGRKGPQEPLVQPPAQSWVSSELTPASPRSWGWTVHPHG